MSGPAEFRGLGFGASGVAHKLKSYFKSEAYLGRGFCEILQYGRGNILG